MQTLEPLLAQHPFLQGLKPEHLATITGCASNVRFEKGQLLFKQGQEANQFFILRHGQVALEIFSPERGPLTIQTIKEDEIIGWSWLVPPYRWHFDAHALELTRAIALDGACLREKCERDHELGYELLKRFADVMASRLTATQMQLLDLYGSTSSKVRR